jgi:hypothetical protein
LVFELNRAPPTKVDVLSGVSCYLFDLTVRVVLATAVQRDGNDVDLRIGRRCTSDPRFEISSDPVSSEDGVIKIYESVRFCEQY